MKTLLLIDANSLIHRSFHALPPFTAPNGEPTGALYGLSAILLKIIKEKNRIIGLPLLIGRSRLFRKKFLKNIKSNGPKRRTN